MRKPKRDSVKQGKTNSSSTPPGTDALSIIPPAPATPVRVRLPLDETVDDVLSASSGIHQLITDAIKSADAHSESMVSLSVSDLKKIKKQASKINKSTALYARELFKRENRFLIEAHILRAAIRRDTTDRDATRSAIYTTLRDKYAQQSAEHAASSSKDAEEKQTPLDKTLLLTSRMQISILDLAPGGASSLLPGSALLEKMEKFKDNRIL